MATKSRFVSPGRASFVLVACLAAAGCLVEHQTTDSVAGSGPDATSDGAAPPGTGSTSSDPRPRADAGANTWASGARLSSYLGAPSDATTGDAGAGNDAGPVLDAGGPVALPPEVARGNPNVTCVRRIFGPARQYVTDVAVAPDGRIGVVGSMSKGNFGLDPTWIDLGNGVVPVGGDIAFVAVYDGACNHLWSRIIGPANPMRAGFALELVAFDGAGSLVIAGANRVPVDFGGGVLPAPDEYDIMLAKYDAAYNLVFAKQFGGAGRQIANALAVDSAGNVYLAGPISDSIDFGGGPLVPPVGPGHRYGAYLAKLSATGAHVFSRAIAIPNPGTNATTSGNINIRSLAVTSAELTVGGAAPEGAVVDIGGGPLSSPSPFGFVARLTDGGAHVWSRSLPVSTPTVLTNGDVAMAGSSLSASVDFGNGPVTGPLVLAKLDGGTRASEWSKGFQLTAPTGNPFSFSAKLAATAPGGFALTTFFDGTLDLGCGPMVATKYFSGSEFLPYYDLVLARFSSTGQCLYSMRFGDRESQSLTRVAVSPNGSTVMAGGYHGTITFGSTVLPNQETPVPGEPTSQPEDGFIAVFSK